MAKAGTATRLCVVSSGADHRAPGAQGGMAPGGDPVVEAARGQRGGHQWGKEHPPGNASMAGAHQDDGAMRRVRRRTGAAASSRRRLCSNVGGRGR
jgi:hypothetical protein